MLLIHSYSFLFRHWVKYRESESQMTLLEKEDFMLKHGHKQAKCQLSPTADIKYRFRQVGAGEKAC